MSSCSITDRQSPTLFSMSSGLSGNSTDLSHKGGYVDTKRVPSRCPSGCFTSSATAVLFKLCFRSTTLKLEGVKRVWGKEGYLAQRESVEEAAQVEVPSPLRSPSEEVGIPPSQTPTPTPTPEPEQEKQQLASSLFVGLASYSSVCLVSLLIHLCLFETCSVKSGEMI